MTNATIKNRATSQKRHLSHAAMVFLTAMGLPIAQNAVADVQLYSGTDVIPSMDLYVRLNAGVRVSGNVDREQYHGEKGSTTVVQGAGNDWGTSMLTLSGDVDLSSETSAVYKLESGFDATTGKFNGGDFLNRRAYVGVKDKRFGTLLVGRDLFINNDIYSFDPMTQQFMSTPTLVYGRNWPNAPQMVQYRSPQWGGFKFGLMATFDNGGEKASSRLSNAYGLSVQYDIRNLSLFGIYDEIRDESGHFTNLYSTSRETIVGATLDLEPVKLFAGYEWLTAPQGKKDLGGTSLQNPGARFTPYDKIYATQADMGWVGASYSVNQHLTLRGAWYHTEINNSGGRADLVTVGTEYAFTPNFMVYATIGGVLNKDNANFSADVYSPPPAPGEKQISMFTGFSIQF